MNTVLDILNLKGHELWAVPPEMSVYDALVTMREKNVGALMVMQDQNLLGILSERDYARKVILEGRASKNTLVSEIMTTSLITCRLQDSVDDCMMLMNEKGVRHLPVLSGDAVKGIISSRDVVAAVIADRERTIDHLERYITARAEIS